MVAKHCVPKGLGFFIWVSKSIIFLTNLVGREGTGDIADTFLEIGVVPDVLGDFLPVLVKGLLEIPLRFRLLGGLDFLHLIGRSFIRTIGIIHVRPPSPTFRLTDDGFLQGHLLESIHVFHQPIPLTLGQCRMALSLGGENLPSKFFRLECKLLRVVEVAKRIDLLHENGIVDDVPFDIRFPVGVRKV